MKVLLAVLAIGICGVLAQDAETEHKRCNRWRQQMANCEADGYIRRRCREADDDVVETKKCKKLDKKLRKNCAMDCPTEEPPVVPDTCWDGPQDDYRGDISVTASGVECQNWSSQGPHEHSRTDGNYPDSGLGDHNNCRNPDGEPSAWCYTSNPAQRWDYCRVPRCEDNNSNQCFDGEQLDYRGPQQLTESGLECQEWSSQSPHEHSRTPDNYPEAGLDNNYCRNPDNEPAGAWCYTTDSNQRWDFCAVPRCEDEEEYCFDGNQEEYRGPKQSTASGKACQNWTSQSPHAHDRTPDNYPDTGLGDHNYCRNPDEDAVGAWCYTEDSGTRWEACGVKTC